jgi:hypothetical protein
MQSLRIPTASSAPKTDDEPNHAGGTLSAQVMPDGSIITRRQAYQNSANAGPINADPSGVFDRIFDPKVTSHSLSVHEMTPASIVSPRVSTAA